MGKVSTSPYVEIKNNIHNFPIYPGSQYLNSETMVCASPFTEYMECGSVTYILETTQDIDTVERWYKENTSKSNWLHKGGAGSRGSYITDLYEKNDSKINLKLTKYGNEETPFGTKIYIIPLSK